MTEVPALDFGSVDQPHLDVALGALESIATQLEAARHLRDEYVRLSRAAAAAVLALPEEIRRLWGRACAAGFAGRAAEVHAARTDLSRRLEAALGRVRNASRLAERAGSLTGEPSPEAGRLAAAAVDLERLKEEIFGRWQTLEDLEDLLAARYPLSATQLTELAAAHPAPAAWYQQQGKPF